MENTFTSTIPHFNEFDPRIIPFQRQLIKHVHVDCDYSLGTHETLLSGSVGSSKSLVAAHLGIKHCLQYSKARFLLGRKTMPDLKETIFRMMLDHLDGSSLVENYHYWVVETKAFIRFRNGSEIVSRSWSDKKYKSKFRSLLISAAIIEELTENDSDEFIDMHTEMIGRIGRLTHIPVSWVLYLTNPDSPSHEAYEYFIRGSRTDKTRHVLYSLTKDNPFLPAWYINKLENTYDAKMILRLLKGQWIHIRTDIIYHEYDADIHLSDKEIKVNKDLPLDFSFDFNIGEGKPMSATIGQYDSKKVKRYFIDEIVMEGTRTLDVLEEAAERGYFDIKGNPVIGIYGDASGKHRDTRSIKTDYTIIKDFLDTYKRKDKQELLYVMHVPLANPPVRKRHNIVNGELKNAKGYVTIVLNKKCKKTDEGFRKAKLVEGGKYVEDDSKDYQHVTTAAGYWCVKSKREAEGISDIKLI